MNGTYIQITTLSEKLRSVWKEGQSPNGSYIFGHNGTAVDWRLLQRDYTNNFDLRCIGLCIGLH